MRDYKNIKAYKLADDLVVAIYKSTKYFPREEIYGLTSQIRRASTSVPTNIAEGASRQHKKDYLNFLYIARASLAETEYLLRLTNRLGFLEKNDFYAISGQTQEVARTLFGLIAAVKKEVKSTAEVI